MSRSRVQALGISAVGLTSAFVLVACGSAGSNQADTSSDTTASGGASSSSGEPGPGFTGGHVVIGTSAPLSGQYAVDGLYTQGEKAYFDYVNSSGGVTMKDGQKRQITLKLFDDGYDPSRTVQNCRQLMQQDNGAAMVMVDGTPTALACGKYLQSESVPNALVFSADSSFSSNSNSIQTGFPLSYTREGTIVADAIKSKLTTGTIAYLQFQGDAGDEYINAIKKGLAGTGIKTVSDQIVTASEPTVSSQMAKILAAHPDVFVQFTAGAEVPQALSAVSESGQHPLQFIIGISSGTQSLGSTGVKDATNLESVTWAKDPSSSAYSSDPEVMSFKSRVAKYGSGKDLDQQISVMEGYIGAELFVNALQRSDPNRQSLNDALHSFKNVHVPGMLPGVVADNSGGGELITSGYVKVFKSGEWAVSGQLSK